MRLGASLRWLRYPSGFSPTLADSLPFWTKIFWPASERTKSINSFAAFGLQLRLIRRSRASGVLRQQRRSETAASFSGVNSRNLRSLTLNRGLKSFEIATKIAYQNGKLSGAPKAGKRDCTTVTNSHAPYRLCC